MTVVDRAGKVGRRSTATRDEEPVARRKQIVTEITPAATFYDAEDYHQRYFEQQGRAACAGTLS